ncbi:ATP-binding protein [Actinocorallia longicatena]|uniref:Histidine kinase/HSP90-like ATPase domain-containing protein n=1 Tax=Actinocorallia longicatena TaxID=111803 RepID=A0ABP6PZD4_9ACTN
MSFPERILAATFDGRADQVRQARRCLTSWLNPSHPVADAAELLLSEAFTNSTLYAARGAAIEVRARLSGSLLHVQVIDPGGASEPVLQAPSAEAEGGRGLALLDLTAKEWGHDRLGDGRLRVWFTLGF